MLLLFHLILLLEIQLIFISNGENIEISLAKIGDFTNVDLNFKQLDNSFGSLQFEHTINPNQRSEFLIKELAFEDKGYLSLTFSWFKNSPLFELINVGAGLVAANTCEFI